MQVLFYPLRNGRFAERNSAENLVKLGSGKSEFFFIDLTAINKIAVCVHGDKRDQYWLFMAIKTWYMAIKYGMMDV